MSLFHSSTCVLTTTICVGLTTGCTTGIVSKPLFSSENKVSDGLTYYLRSSSIKLTATYKLKSCVKPEAQLEGLTLSDLTTKDGRDGAVFAIDTKELAAGSKVFDTVIGLQDGFIKSINYKSTDKTGELMKNIATIAVKLPLAVSGTTLNAMGLKETGFSCHQETTMKVNLYDENQSLIKDSYDVLRTLQHKLSTPVMDSVSDGTTNAGLQKLKEQIIAVLTKQGGITENKDLADVYKKYLDLLDSIIAKQKALTGQPSDAQKTELANAIKAIQDLITIAQAASDKLGADLLATFNSTVTPADTKSIFPKFDYTPALKWGQMANPENLFNANVALDVSECRGRPAEPPLCNTGAVDCTSTGKSYAIYYRTPAICKMTVTTNGIKLSEIDNKEFLQFGKLNRLAFKNGPFEDTEQSVTFDANGNITEYKQSAKLSATDTALSSISESADTLSQRKLEKIQAQKAIVDAEKDLYESQKKRDDALQALSNNEGSK